MSRRPADISIILNLHNEAGFLLRTLRSLGEAVQFARHDGLSFELVVVLDRPTSAVRTWVAAHDFSDFDACTVIEVDNGSLGPSRNDGIRAARGTYIVTADADDLISYNMFLELYRTATSAPPKTIVIPEYVLGFGDNKDHLAQLFGGGEVLKLGFFSYHPYVSRIFAHRDLFAELSYQDVSPATGFAFEDWHFNCEATRLGYEFSVAKNTTLYYRRRAGSLQKSAGRTIGQPPFSPFFQPASYLKACARDYERFQAGMPPRPDASEIKRRFTHNHICQDTLIAANFLDPAIDGADVSRTTAFSNLESFEAGAAYFRLCDILQDRAFTDIVLLPFLSAGGAERYILGVLGALAELDSSRRILVLAGEQGRGHVAAEDLPADILFVDINEIFENCPEEALDFATLRVIQAAGPDALLHIKGSPYGQRFFRKFKAVLEGHKAVYYRFSDAHVNLDGTWVKRGFESDFLSDCGEDLWKIITDNESLRLHDLFRLDSCSRKYFTLYNQTDLITDDASLNLDRPRQDRLLWASRLDNEKRPELLIAMARRLAEVRPQLEIHVYGTALFRNFDERLFTEAKNIVYRGAFSGFRTLPYQDFDAFLYTSAYDGLPNVVLEAMSAGLPVVAPDLGGIAEAIVEETGFLIGNDPDDEGLIRNYLEAIATIYADGTDLRAIRLSALKRVQERHSRQGFLARVAALFDVFDDNASPSPIQRITAQ